MGGRDCLGNGEATPEIWTLALSFTSPGLETIKPSCFSSRTEGHSSVSPWCPEPAGFRFWIGFLQRRSHATALPEQLLNFSRRPQKQKLLPLLTAEGNCLPALQVWPLAQNGIWERAREIHRAGTVSPCQIAMIAEIELLWSKAVYL